MIEIKGKYNAAICYCDELEKSAEGQIKVLCDQDFFGDSKIRVMPDVHAGMGCTIGTTMTIGDKVVPGMVGVDIGCGMETVKIAETNIDLEKLDRLIYEKIPCGTNIRKTYHPLNDEIDLERTSMWRQDETGAGKAEHRNSGRRKPLHRSGTRQGR